ncbi:TetR/AcrR family transcriptional regulator [Aldersonia sp. NBC_00410]|uniref:TetR/AcrR family transcriptional regulator n=1 Tax=Aldersonia sp. NBC_00410 TaxID=2975954 RepID=UPI00224E4CDE|nr:TetR/AcrR family transcriptional regulator [Aldersonia sp. NBC_00410]MCX5042092.1 TetR/AcrR family transcriptional regulator [Aldersonia sp. NBC_00410]
MGARDRPSVPTRSDRDRILDAAEVCLLERGIGKTTMAEVAAAAGVSRAWLYRLYQDKVSLFGAVMVRIDSVHWQSEGVRVRAATTLVDTIVESVLLARQMQQRPLIVKLRESEPAAFSQVAEIGMQHFIPWLSATWRGYLVAAQRRGEVSPEISLDLASEWVARIVLSMCTVPSRVVDTDDRDSMRPFVNQFLLHGLHAPTTAAESEKANASTG